MTNYKELIKASQKASIQAKTRTLLQGMDKDFQKFAHCRNFIIGNEFQKESLLSVVMTQVQNVCISLETVESIFNLDSENKKATFSEYASDRLFKLCHVHMTETQRGKDYTWTCSKLASLFLKACKFDLIKAAQSKSENVCARYEAHMEAITWEPKQVEVSK